MSDEKVTTLAKLLNQENSINFGSWKLLNKLVSTMANGDIYLTQRDGEEQICLCKRQPLKDQNKNRWGIRDRKKESLLLREAQHPNVVELLDYVEENAESVLVMEYLSPDKWKDVFAWAKNGVVSTQQILHIATELAQTLAFIHQKGISHNDIKNNNIFIGGDGENLKIKIIDFGDSVIIDENLANQLSLTSMSELKERFKSKDVKACQEIVYELILGSDWRHVGNAGQLYAEMERKFGATLASNLVGFINEAKNKNYNVFDDFVNELRSCMYA